ncbi:MAG: extracellular solute-binding protein [Acidimicrobiia bacterium]|nr:extracellular solute-binding protein [Acidimicrobiia bacterium]
MERHGRVGVGPRDPGRRWQHRPSPRCRQPRRRDDHRRLRSSRSRSRRAQLRRVRGCRTRRRRPSGVEEGGGVPVGDGSLWISEAASPEQRGAAWQYIKFLSEPEQQAELHLAGGYVPTRLSAIDDPAVQARWEEEPAFRFAVDQLVESETTLATVGSVIGDYQGVRNAVTKALEGMLAGDLTPEEALAQAQQEADAAIQEYNARIGE